MQLSQKDGDADWSRQCYQIRKRYVDGVFVCGKPSFIITDDMTVPESNSTNVYLQVVRDQGYLDFDKLSESLLVIGSEELFTLT